MLTVLPLFLNIALADIPPPPSYVERCTVENHAVDGKECTTCRGNFAMREGCEKLEADGYTKACSTYGASNWTEVMCRAKGGEQTGDAPGDAPKVDPKTGPSDAPEAEAKDDPSALPSDVVAEKRRCNTSAGSASWLALLGLLLVSRRRVRA